MVGFTANFRLTKPDFNSEGWDTQINTDLDLIDSILGQFNTGFTIQGVWLNATLYPAGGAVIDGTTGHVWQASATYTSSASPITFAADRIAFPTIWTDITNPAIGAAASAANALISANNAAASLASLTALFGGGSTGTGSLVLSTGPTIVNPTFTGLGAITPSSVTTGAISGTTGQFTGLITPNGGIKGVSTAVNQAVGNVGEYQSSGAPGTSATVTITIAVPGVISWTAHNIIGIAPIQFTTTGALPTGLSVGTVYWTIPGSITANTFQLATSIANAIAGTAITTSGSQSGVQSCFSYLPSATTVISNCAAIQLTAGDWEVEGSLITIYNSGTISLITAAISIVSGVVPASPYLGGLNQVSGAFASLGSCPVIVTGRVRLLLAATTTVYVVGQQNSGSTATGLAGFIQARRVI